MSMLLMKIASMAAFLPVMDFSFRQIPAYLRGIEFRTLMAELITQVMSGVVDAVLIAAIQSAFGVLGS